MNKLQTIEILEKTPILKRLNQSSKLSAFKKASSLVISKVGNNSTMTARSKAQTTEMRSPESEIENFSQTMNLVSMVFQSTTSKDMLSNFATALKRLFKVKSVNFLL